jgi:hypothetical protein
LWGGALIFTALVGYSIVKYKNSQKNTTIKANVPYQEVRQTVAIPKNKRRDTEQEDKELDLRTEYALAQTLFFSLVGFMVTAFFLSKTFHLLLFIFMGMNLACHIRLVKLEPKIAQFFNTKVAIRSTLYCWVIIIAVYIALKLGL